ncbi:MULTISPECIES: hypothetical protein [unclassified Streptomyces]|uniref:hypothetical protein n=1 Tax=unclassified Streptomyces TaxID=2593676 RepID=UPI000F6BD3EE|nr:MULTISPECIES: hypothetical protein [unclassified Streptomyces]AZM62512.1 hypothetical protein DLM49_25925 [Streptomyces sp. WAC 01438]RSM92515.1 hypothetical protein DMA10_24435 [Streptomyces sp. WAC 01420]
MKSWRSRIAVALGTAALALPLAAGSASAAESNLYTPVGGTPDRAECLVWAWEGVAEGRYSHYMCIPEGEYWNLYVIYADRPM